VSIIALSACLKISCTMGKIEIISPISIHLIMKIRLYFSRTYKIALEYYILGFR
jgi:hypothetical protein